MAEPSEIAIAVLARLMELIKAPLTDHKMLWTAVPLVIATIFITVYFGKYRREELGWNSAFGNTMVFLFVSINIIQYMYYSGGTGSIDNILSNQFYLTVALVLAAVAAFFMFIVYYHLLPKRVAFFLFSAPPVNVSAYVLMTMVYTGVPVDYITLAAAVLLFLIIFFGLKLIQKIEEMAGHPEGLFASEEKKERPKKKKAEPEEAEEAEE